MCLVYNLLKQLSKQTGHCLFSCNIARLRLCNFMNKYNACMIDKRKLQDYNDSNNGNGAIGSMVTSAVILFLNFFEDMRF
jgi:hypothetical protein